MLPVETILAVFPTGVVVGKNLTLRPLTLAHITALEALGVDTEGDVTKSQAAISAWILSKTPKEVFDLMGKGLDPTGFEEWWKGLDVSVEEAFNGVKKAFKQAFLPFVPGKDKGNEIKNKKGDIDTNKSGYGWTLEIAEGHAHEYGMTLEEALSEPISRIAGMRACSRIRNGGEAGGPDYYERVILSRVKVAKGVIQLANRAKKEVKNGNE